AVAVGRLARRAVREALDAVRDAVAVAVVVEVGGRSVAVRVDSVARPLPAVPDAVAVGVRLVGPTAVVHRAVAARHEPSRLAARDPERQYQRAERANQAPHPILPRSTEVGSSSLQPGRIST